MNKTAKISNLTFEDGQWSCFVWGEIWPFRAPITNEAASEILRKLKAKGVKVGITLDLNKLIADFPATVIELPD